MKSKIILKKNEERRILTGHLWIFSNEIKRIEGAPQAGDIIEIYHSDGKFLGVGLYNPRSLIAVRMLSTEREVINNDFFKKRILKALELRKKIYTDTNSYRLVYGESDFLPGLIIDRYEDCFSIQTFSAGMENFIPIIVEILQSLFKLKTIVKRNESPLRTLEHLPLEKGILIGTDIQPRIKEHNIIFEIDLIDGQKTGFYLDQRENRLLFRRFVKDTDVLDIFCNDGGFTLNSYLGGAKSTIGIDISESAARRANKNISLNEYETSKIIFKTADAFDSLKEFASSAKRFDVVNVDPPSFTRSKKNITQALKGYIQINSLALVIIKSGGFLSTASCSHHISEDAFLGAIEQAAKNKKRKLQLVEFAGAGPDHPVLPAMPETKYLKFAVFSVT